MDSQTTVGDSYAEVCLQLSTLILGHPPPFIYVHDPLTPRVATSTIVSALYRLKDSSGLNLAIAPINAISCFTPRLLYDTVLNALAGWSPNWEDGCANWSGPLEGTSQRFNESFDGFTHGLRAIWNELLARQPDPSAVASRMAKATAEQSRLVLLLENAERLKETMPDLLAPLSRIAELVSISGCFAWSSRACLLAHLEDHSMNRRGTSMTFHGCQQNTLS